ncbi:hypothetical protein GT347_26360 [Xylophilus rhododendri]|uniref:HTH luxR-type domain-containing protein n=1 Tax=Xylophilus rhododendri TaxID=2697032 RepID=A0A857JDC3_9BURK|nr:hypothetical protein [Xylophilus rhododendri]QHJ01202.1 hypothetical protein GT347_26360 [Xylophilus rhododendri]
MEVVSDLYDQLVHQIYDAALHPARWAGVVERITAACGGSSGMLFTPMAGPAEGGMAIVNNIPQATLEFWAARSIHDDPYVQAAHRRGLVREGVAINGSDLVSDTELIATRFYRELWAPIELRRLCYGVIFDGTDSFKLPTVISVFGRLRDQPFNSAHTELIERLLPHLSRALGVMFHLREAHLREAVSLAALDRLASGVVLLDGRAHVCFANTAARRQVQASDRWELRRDPLGREQLVLADRRDKLDVDFQRTVAAAIDPLSTAVPEHFSEAMILPDAHGRPGWVVHVAPLGADGADSAFGSAGGAGARAIVFLYDLAAASAVPPKLLSKLFGTTPAESRAALQLLQGGSIEVMAERLGVAANTLKSQLKSVYGKTRTHRQADLLKLLLSLATP